MAYGEGGALSASDIALLNRDGNGGFGDGNGAWWIILFLIFGWGRNGFGNNGGNCGANTTCATPADVANAVDQQTLISKLDQQTYGLADSTFALNNTITNGFFGVQNAMCQGFNGLNNAVAQSSFNTERGMWNLSSQLSDCCCTTQRAIDGVNYNMATNTCAITTNATMNTRDIIDAVNANYRSLHDEIFANRMEDKNAQIQAQQNEINALRLAASQAKQNNYLVNELRPCPVPAYITCNPYQSYSSCGCGF